MGSFKVVALGVSGGASLVINADYEVLTAGRLQQLDTGALHAPDNKSTGMVLQSLQWIMNESGGVNVLHHPYVILDLLNNRRDPSPTCTASSTIQHPSNSLPRVASTVLLCSCTIACIGITDIRIISSPAV